MSNTSNTRALFLLFTADAVSGFSQGLTMLAIPWYFAKQNQSSTFTLAYGFITLLVLFFGLYAGTLVDKYSRKGNFLAINLICGSFILAIADSAETQNTTIAVPLSAPVTVTNDDAAYRIDAVSAILLEGSDNGAMKPFVFEVSREGYVGGASMITCPSSASGCNNPNPSPALR